MVNLYDLVDGERRIGKGGVFITPNVPSKIMKEYAKLRKKLAEEALKKIEL